VSERPAINYFAHESAFIDAPCDIGSNTRIWHGAHILAGARIGRDCTIGQNVMVAGKVVIGDRVKIQNNVSLYDGTTIEDGVFLGPSCVLTNVSNPRSEIARKELFETTVIRRGATVGANATIVCGVSLGCYCFIGAGAVVTRDVPAYALMLGNPANQDGWMSRHGHRLRPDADGEGELMCPESGFRYVEEAGVLRCADLEESAPLPDSMRLGRKAYRDFQSD
jgi:UDP-2-acetamido-3-amino-2,3-dideoxy-glucuronate N-acetyltransferase